MATHKKETLGTDSEGRFRRRIGWKVGGDNRLTQHLFRLGRDREQALLANAKLEQLWAAVEARWQRLRRKGIPTDTSPQWDDITLEIGKAIAHGETTCTITPPAGMENLAPAQLVIWLQSLQQDFQIIHLQLPDSQQQRYKTGQQQRVAEAEELEGLAQEYKSAAKVLRGTPISGTIKQALQSFFEHAKRKYGTTAFCKSLCNRLQFLITNTVDGPLSSLTGERLTEWVGTYRRRPMGKRGQLSKSYCRETVKTIKDFVLWLDASEEYQWELPRKYKFGRIKIEDTSEELAKRIRTDTIKRFTVEELATLWEYARPLERVVLLLGINCGFGRAEMSTLMLDEIFLNHTHERYKVTASWIRRLRRKTKVPGEWLLWPQTVQAIEWLRKNRPNTKTGHLFVTADGTHLDCTTNGNNPKNRLPNMWAGLLRRIKKDHPEFKTLGLKYLRKTGASLVRAVGGGEVASLYLSHGPTADTEDKLLAVYASRPFGKLHKSLRRLGHRLQVEVFSKVENPFPEIVKETRPAISLGKIKRIKELRNQGYTLRKIAEMVGVSAGTVKKYC